MLKVISDISLKVLKIKKIMSSGTWGKEDGSATLLWRVWCTVYLGGSGVEDEVLLATAEGEDPLAHHLLHLNNTAQTFRLLGNIVPVSKQFFTRIPMINEDKNKNLLCLLSISY